MRACGHHPAGVLPADPYRVAVQVVPDDLQLPACFFRGELRTPVLPPHHPADVVADPTAVHPASPSAGPPKRLRHAPGATPSGPGRTTARCRGCPRSEG